jgi:hypothetical protein
MSRRHVHRSTIRERYWCYDLSRGSQVRVLPGVPVKQADPGAGDPAAVTAGDSRSVFGGLIFEPVTGVPDDVAALAEATRAGLSLRAALAATRT